MKCTWRNLEGCPHRNRCCKFCDIKNCWQRCTCKPKRTKGQEACGYFIDEKDEDPAPSTAAAQ